MNQNLVVVYDITLNLVPSDNIPDLVRKIENYRSCPSCRVMYWNLFLLG